MTVLTMYHTVATSEADEITVVIPIRNAIAFAERQVKNLQKQSVQPRQVIVIDSESSDGSPTVYRDAGYTVIPIKASDFDHGATRNLGLHLIPSL